MKAILILKDGTYFEGTSFGYEGEGSFLQSGEVVFNTSMSGYQEILTDPSYQWQMVCMTYPEIGNYGVSIEDQESANPRAAALIVKRYHPTPSNFRATQSLSDYLKKHKIPAIEGIDTRCLVRHLRDKGAQVGFLAIGEHDVKKLIKEAKKLEGMENKDLVKEVTCQQSYEWTKPLWSLDKSSKVPSSSSLRLIAYDFGIKQNILRNLVSAGFKVKVVPAHYPAAEVLKEKPDGVFFSNGPGDPAAVTYGVENISQIVGKIPSFGICLGHQMMALSLGAKTYKLKFGHRGGNQPVIDLATKKVEITSQNHGFAVEEESLKKVASLTHINLNDKTVEGLANEKLKCFSVQYHPEASPGPHDSFYLFERFKEMILK